jgi:iron complex outermembrane receptor protein
LAPVDDRGGESRTQLFKPSLLYTPTESFELSIIAEKGRIDSDGALSQLDSVQALGDFEFRQPFDSESEMDWQHIIGEANYDIAFGDGTITSIVSYREVKSNVENDDIQGSGVPGFIADAVTQQQQLTGELRYAGSFFEDFWSVTTGLFWLNDDIFYRERRRIAGGAINVRLGGAQERWSAGAFVNNEFAVTPEITLLGGIRYNAEYKEADACIQAPIAGAALATPTGDLACPSDFSDNDSWYNWSPKVGVQYQPTDDLQMYATWSKGFRSGGYSLRNNDPAFPPGPTEDEEQSAFEIGFKSDWFNNRVRLNVSAFYNEIEDLQRTVIFPGMAGTVQLITNAGDGTTKGVEVDATAAITENFVVQTSMGYLEDDYDEVIFDLNGDGMVTPADRDLEFPRAPRWTWYIGGTYDLPVTEWGTLTFNANYSFTDDFFTNDSNNASVKDAHLMNGSVAFTEITERFKLAGFVKNILNEDHAELAVQLGAALGGEQRYLNPPRTYGVELSYTYN